MGHPTAIPKDPKNISLAHTAGGTYDGFADVAIDGETLKLKINVEFDGDKYSWKTSVVDSQGEPVNSKLDDMKERCNKFSIQVAAYETTEEADKEIEQLSHLSITARKVNVFITDRGTLTAVRFGCFDSLPQAKEYALQQQQRGAISEYIIKLGLQ